MEFLSAAFVLCWVARLALWRAVQANPMPSFDTELHKQCHEMLSRYLNAFQAAFIYVSHSDPPPN